MVNWFSGVESGGEGKHKKEKHEKPLTMYVRTRVKHSSLR